MRRILFLILAELIFFVIFASSYSALDGGNAVGTAVGFFGGMFVAPGIFVISVLYDVIQWFRKRLRK